LFSFILYLICTVLFFEKNIQTYPRIGLFEKMMYRRIRICRIPIHVSVSMLPSAGDFTNPDSLTAAFLLQATGALCYIRHCDQCGVVAVDHGRQDSNNATPVAG
jgi:hypothetical protein